MSNNVRTLPDYFSDPADKAKINAQFLQIEFMRDFIVWLCEVECDSTVSELEEKFKDDVAKLEGE